MADQLPTPPVSADADLTDFKFMPLEIARLRKSRAWLICKRRPELAFYMLNLWTAAWHERPAGSLEDDDDVLADAAMCSPEKWAKVRDAVLRGWERHSDGRLYHTVVTEKVLDSWHGKLVARWKKECDRIRKENHKRKEAGQPALDFPPEPKRKAVAAPADGDGIPAEKPLKGEGERRDRDRESKNEREQGRAQRAQPIPPDWQPSNDDVAWAEKTRPDIQPSRLKLETDGFRNHALANNRTFHQVGPAWRNWIMKARIGGGGPPAHGGVGSRSSDKPDYLEAFAQGASTAKQPTKGILDT